MSAGRKPPEKKPQPAAAARPGGPAAAQPVQTPKPGIWADAVLRKAVAGGAAGASGTGGTAGASGAGGTAGASGAGGAAGASGPGGGGAPGADPRAVRAQLGSGAEMESGTRARMERAFGTRFAGVRVHTDARAGRVAAGLAARALTVGDHVAFAPGEYRPGTPEGDALLAHELAHTLQQRGASEPAAHGAGVGPGPLEAEADRSAAGVLRALWGGAAAAGAERTLPRPGAGLRLQRCSREQKEQTQQPAPSAGPSADASAAPSADASAAPATPSVTMPTDPADQAIIQEIMNFELAQRRLFLTGRLPTSDAIYGKIQARLDEKIAELQGMGPPKRLVGRSRVRLFSARPKLEGAGTPQAQIVFNKFFLIEEWDTLPKEYRGSKGRKKWLALDPAERLKIILRYSAVPGASRHHWGTEVDFNSTEVKAWKKGGDLEKLGTWLQENAPKVGFKQSYDEGRGAGHSAEAWHYSYAPLAIPLKEMWLRDVNLQEDFVEPLMKDWEARLAAVNSGRPEKKKLKMPENMRETLAHLNVREYVETIAPGL